MTPSLRWLVATSLLAVGVLPRPTAAACVDYPEFLHREGGVALPGTAEEVAVQGDYAYVAAAFGDLAVVDISDPDAPRLVTRVILPDEKHGAHDVVVSGHYAYVAAVNAGLQVIDIAQPTQPVIIGWTPTIDAALGVDVRGNYAYVAAREAGLVIVDITDPTSPGIAGSVLTLAFALKVKVVGTRAYVADRDGGLVIVDVSNPAGPIVLGHVDTPEWAVNVDLPEPSNGAPRMTDGTFAYVATQDAGLQIVDVSNPASPVIVGTLPSTDAENVTVVDGLAYVGNWVCVLIIDVSVPTAPVVVSSISLPGGGALGIATVLPRIFVATNGSGLSVVNVANPASPPLVSSLDTRGIAYDLAIDGDRAYVADSNAGLGILNISNPEAPQILTQIALPVFAYDVDVSGNMAFVGSFDTLTVIEVPDPIDSGKAVIRSHFNNPGPLNDLKAEGSYVYLAAGNSGFQVIDVVVPDTPTLVAQLPVAGYATALNIHADLAYVLSSGLDIVDISDPTKASIIGHANLPAGDTPMAVTIRLPYAYVARWGGLNVLDVSEPTNPVVVGNLPISGPAMDVALDGPLAYIANGALGTVIVDITAPNAPAVLTFAPLSSSRIIIEDELAFAIDGGFKVLALQCETITAVDHPLESAQQAHPYRLTSWPNPAPAGSAIAISFELQSDTRLQIDVYDLTGRLVRRLADRSMERGRHVLEWDGLNDQGRRVSSGVYAYRLEATDGTRAARTLVRLR